MGAARAVVEDKVLHPVAKLSERGGGRGAGKTGTHDDDLVFPLVGRIDELDLGFVLLPFAGERARGNFGVEFGHDEIGLVLGDAGS